MRDGDIVKIAVIVCAAVLACSASVILFNGKAAADTSIRSRQEPISSMMRSFTI